MNNRFNHPGNSDAALWGKWFTTIRGQNLFRRVPVPFRMQNRFLFRALRGSHPLQFCLWKAHCTFLDLFR